jgi:hypothetical protein
MSQPNGRALAGLPARLCRPEYTGENRCLPCTAVNLVIAAGLTGATATVSLPAAAAVGAVSLASIYARGYLVPGTPELTKRYLPERVLGWFGKAEVEPTAAADPDFDVVDFLGRTGVLVDDADDVALAPAFEAALGEAALAFGDEATVTAAAADLLAVEPDRLSFAAVGDSWTRRSDGGSRARRSSPTSPHTRRSTSGRTSGPRCRTPHGAGRCRRSAPAWKPVPSVRATCRSGPNASAPAAGSTRSSRPPAPTATRGCSRPTRAPSRPRSDTLSYREGGRDVEGERRKLYFDLFSGVQ